MIGSLPHSPQLPSLPGPGQGKISLEDMSPESLTNSLSDNSQAQNPQNDFMNLLQGLQVSFNPEQAKSTENLKGSELAQADKLVLLENGLPLKTAELAVSPGHKEHDLSKLVNLSKFHHPQSKVVLGQSKAIENVSNPNPSSIQLRDLVNTPFDQIQIEGKPKALKQAIEIPDFKNIQMNKMQAPQKMVIDQYQFQNPAIGMIKLSKGKLENVGLENVKQSPAMSAMSEMVEKKVNSMTEGNATDNDFLNMANKESKAAPAIKMADQTVSEPLTTKTIDEMSKQFELPIRRGEKEFSIQVRDQQIGDMKIKATQGKDGIHLRVESNSVEVQDFLNSHKSRIIENLANSGIRVSEVKIEQGSMTSQDKDFSQSQHEQAKHGHGRDRQDDGKERRKELWEMFQEQSRAA